MENIRCLIADIPQLILADIVQSLVEENEYIKVIDRLVDIEDLPDALKKKILMS